MAGPTPQAPRLQWLVAWCFRLPVVGILYSRTRRALLKGVIKKKIRKNPNLPFVLWLQLGRRQLGMLGAAALSRGMATALFAKSNAKEMRAGAQKQQFGTSSIQGRRPNQEDR